MGKSIFSRAGLITSEDKKDLEKRLDELEQAIGDAHATRRQQEHDAARRERAVMERIDDVERTVARRMDAIEASIAREMATLSHNITKDLAAFRPNPGIDTKALSSAVEQEIARQMAAFREESQKGAQDLKNSLALTLQYVANAQEQGFSDILKRHAAIEAGLIETAGQIAEGIEKEHEAISTQLASLDTAQRDSGEAAAVRERKRDEQTYQLQQFLQNVASALETLATKKDLDLLESLLHLQEVNQLVSGMVEKPKEEPSSSDLLAEKKTESMLILPHGVKRF